MKFLLCGFCRFGQIDYICKRIEYTIDNMKKILTVIGLLLGFCQGNVTAQEDLDAEYAKDLLKPGTEVPAIMVGESGNQTNWLQRDKPQYTILEFWASWCGDCRRDMAKMRRINRVFCSDSIYIKGYSFDTKAESWEKCQKDSVLAWSHQLSPVTMRDSEVAQAFHLNWIPSYYLVGKDGKVILSTVMIDKLEAKLREIVPDAKEDDLPLSSTFPCRQEVMMDMVRAIAMKMKYPEECQKYGAEGKVRVSFVIDKDGNVSDISPASSTITNVSGKAFDKLTVDEQKQVKEQFAKLFATEAVKALKEVDKGVWKKADNGRGKMKLTLPATFRLR